MSQKYEYPPELIEYLTEKEAEGSEIIISPNEDSTLFIVTQKDFSDWITLLEWTPGEKEAEMVHVSGRAFERLQSEMLRKQLEKNAYRPLAMINEASK